LPDHRSHRLHFLPPPPDTYDTPSLPGSFRPLYRLVSVGTHRHGPHTRHGHNARFISVSCHHGRSPRAAPHGVPHCGPTWTQFTRVSSFLATPLHYHYTLHTHTRYRFNTATAFFELQHRLRAYWFGRGYKPRISTVSSFTPATTRGSPTWFSWTWFTALVLPLPLPRLPTHSHTHLSTFCGCHTGCCVFTTSPRALAVHCFSFPFTTVYTQLRFRFLHGSHVYLVYATLHLTLVPVCGFTPPHSATPHRSLLPQIFGFACRAAMPFLLCHAAHRVAFINTRSFATPRQVYTPVLHFSSPCGHANPFLAPVWTFLALQVSLLRVYVPVSFTPRAPFTSHVPRHAFYGRFGPTHLPVLTWFTFATPHGPRDTSFTPFWWDRTFRVATHLRSYRYDLLSPRRTPHLLARLRPLPVYCRLHTVLGCYIAFATVHGSLHDGSGTRLHTLHCARFTLVYAPHRRSYRTTVFACARGSRFGSTATAHEHTVTLLRFYLVHARRTTRFVCDTTMHLVTTGHGFTRCARFFHAFTRAPRLRTHYHFSRCAGFRFVSHLRTGFPVNWLRNATPFVYRGYTQHFRWFLTVHAHILP